MVVHLSPSLKSKPSDIDADVELRLQAVAVLSGIGAFRQLVDMTLGEVTVRGSVAGDRFILITETGAQRVSRINRQCGRR